MMMMTYGVIPMVLLTFAVLLPSGSGIRAIFGFSWLAWVYFMIGMEGCFAMLAAHIFLSIIVSFLCNTIATFARLFY